MLKKLYLLFWYNFCCTLFSQEEDTDENVGDNNDEVVMVATWLELFLHDLKVKKF